ncbi:MAG: ornithine cyclodeaminase family protein [Woeseia sp.]
MQRHAISTCPHLQRVLIFDQQAVASALPYKLLIDAIAKAFASDTVTPARTTHAIRIPGQADGTLLLMPAWQEGAKLGVKIAGVFPDNAQRGLASVQASYLLLDATSGVPLAVLDGAELTLRRTAAASALASRYLSPESAETLLIVGTGKLAPHLVAAHAAVRRIKRVLVWGRRPAQALKLSQKLARPGLQIDIAASLPSAVAEADIISCATLSETPLIKGEWLRPGQHLDLVGAFTKRMAEADGDAVARAQIFVDTFEGALSEAGELVQALQAGLIARDAILADLAMLVRGRHPGRVRESDITLFKSVGTAIEDLAAARCVMEQSKSKAS